MYEDFDGLFLKGHGFVICSSLWYTNDYFQAIEIVPSWEGLLACNGNVKKLIHFWSCNTSLHTVSLDSVHA